MWFKRFCQDSQLYHYPFHSKDKAAIRKLVDRGMNVKIPRRKGKDPPIVTCVKGGHCDNAMLLLENKKLNVNQTGPDEKSALYLACDRKFVCLAEALLRRGADVNQPGWNGSTPLHVACNGNTNEGLIEQLLQHGANANICNSVGDTPLHHLCNNPNNTLAIVEILLRQGRANINLTNRCGESPLYVLLKKFRGTQSDILYLLLNEGADVNQGDVFGNTPLHVVATRCSDSSVLEVLLDYGANINQRNKAGWTALKMTLNPDVIKFLRNQGAVLWYPSIDLWCPHSKQNDWGHQQKYDLDLVRVYNLEKKVAALCGTVCDEILLEDAAMNGVISSSRIYRAVLKYYNYLEMVLWTWLSYMYISVGCSSQPQRTYDNTCTRSVCLFVVAVETHKTYLYSFLFLVFLEMRFEAKVTSTMTRKYSSGRAVCSPDNKLYLTLQKDVPNIASPWSTIDHIISWLGRYCR